MESFDQIPKAVEREIANRHPLHKGDEITFTCPSHEDNRPSARWNRVKRVWYCDACGTGGGFVDLAKRLGAKLR